MQTLFQRGLHATPDKPLFRGFVCHLPYKPLSSDVCMQLLLDRFACRPHTSSLSQGLYATPMQTLFLWVCMQAPFQVGLDESLFSEVFVCIPHTSPFSRGVCTKPMHKPLFQEDLLAIPVHSPFHRDLHTNSPARELHATLCMHLFRGFACNPQGSLLSQEVACYPYKLSFIRVCMKPHASPLPQIVAGNSLSRAFSEEFVYNCLQIACKTLLRGVCMQSPHNLKTDHRHICIYI